MEYYEYEYEMMLKNNSIPESEKILIFKKTMNYFYNLYDHINTQYNKTYYDKDLFIQLKQINNKINEIYKKEINRKNNLIKNVDVKEKEHIIDIAQQNEENNVEDKNKYTYDMV